MKLGDLFEDAHADITANKAANDIATKFAQWFMPKNEETPLKNIEGVHFINLHKKRVAYFDAGTFGVNAPNLHVGFAWNRDGGSDETRGLMIRARMGDDVHYFVVNVMKEDSTDEIDIAYSIRWNTFIHELIHYFDFSRGNFKTGHITKKDGAEYYNDPTEFNAHFQQGLYDILQQFSSKSERVSKTVKSIMAGDFYDFAGWAKSFMPKSFHLYLTPDNKKKFERRLYKLWEYLRSKSNSDTDQGA